MQGFMLTIPLVYLHDILVYTPTVKEHICRLDSVFERLKQHGIRLIPDKCRLVQQRTPFLGHVLTPNGLETDPGKVKAVSESPVPKTLKELRSFLALAGYYRKFVKGLMQAIRDLEQFYTKVVDFASRGLRNNERRMENYSSFKLELLALKWAVCEKFRDYLWRATFTVVTDNNPLRHLHSAKLGAKEQR
ncbi:hypothetical protein RRG08_053896 [Elysia crispata]|uniref:Reverse transcriptase domain-containing protein n=1 Tax=Elysia crispata TaxID=231223 RepID=A0AAE1DJB5_9GAST|nr:hypothetical protein RRG08_053896 [Elysia crispata]